MADNTTSASSIEQMLATLRAEPAVASLDTYLAKRDLALRVVPAQLAPDPAERDETSCWFNLASDPVELHAGVTEETSVDELVFTVAYTVCDRQLPAPRPDDPVQATVVTAGAFQVCLALDAPDIVRGEARHLARTCSRAALGQCSAEERDELGLRLWSLLIVLPDAETGPLVAGLGATYPPAVEAGYRLLRAGGSELPGDEAGLHRLVRLLRAASQTNAPSARTRLAARPSRDSDSSS